MNVEQVRKFSQLEIFLYWIKERHNIYLNKEAGEPKPWTDDTILQRYYFTNPYRENDKTTVWFRENVRGPLANDPIVLFATVAFRWFNRIRTGELLLEHDLLTNWDEQRAVKLLHKRRDEVGQVFTGAYMIKAGNGPPGCKIGNVCSAITTVWKQRKELAASCSANMLEHTWRELKKVQYLGGFMSYEIVCDLRYTDLLCNSTDVDTWCNPGPGAKRGMNRLLGRPLDDHIPAIVWTEETQKLLAIVRKRLYTMPKFEMREVEHSMCESDKYCRALSGNRDMKMKRKYNGTAN